MNRQLLFSVILLGVFCSGCGQSDLPEPTPEASAHGKPPAEKDVIYLPASVQELVGIKLAEVRYRKCPTVLRALGTVQVPRPQTAIVSHAFPGRVAEIRVEVGDWVKKGQPLVVLESKEVGEAKAEFYKALADWELAKVNLAREERLLKEGIGVGKNFLTAEAEYKVAQANLDAAEKRLHVLGFTEEEVKEMASTHQINPTLTLYAPIEGKVVELNVVRGQMVEAGTPILTLIDPRVLWIDAEIYEKDIAKVKIGQRVEIRTVAYPGEVFTGKISYVSDVVNPETRTITVRTEVPNESQLLKPGMFADVDIVLDEGEKAIVVPSAAILEEGDRKIVFVKEADHFVRREITTGAVYEACHQVLSGLEVGEQVVVEGNHQLRSKLYEELLKAASVD